MILRAFEQQNVSGKYPQVSSPFLPDFNQVIFVAVLRALWRACSFFFGKLFDDEIPRIARFTLGKKTDVKLYFRGENIF